MIYYRTIHLADTDAAGVVYFATLLSICHEAYESALKEAGIELKQFLQGAPVALPIVRAEIDFFRPLLCGDNLAIHLTPHQISDTDFEIAYQVLVAPASNVCLAKALTRHACINTASRRRVSLPPEWRGWLGRI